MKTYLLVTTSLMTVVASACSSETELRQNGCASCHQPEDSPQGGIEAVHSEFALTCGDCHGGDPDQTTKEMAHVPKPADFTQIRELAASQLSAADAAYVRFRAPTHPAIATQSCGSSSPQAAAGAGCHQNIIDTSELSVHTSNVGLITVARFNHNIQAGRPPVTGVVAVNNQFFQSSTAPMFTYASLAGVELAPLNNADPADPRPYVDHTNTKLCTGCHLGVFGGGVDSGNTGLYRGVGCAGCHVAYGLDGLSKSSNPLAEKDAPAHPEKHVIEGAAPDRVCESCHYRSYRTALGYKGWRERSETSDLSPNAETNPEPAHGRPAGFYVIDEDGTNDRDETPADLHFLAGMACADCHVGVDVHGDGHIRPNMGAETGIECQDCHGTFEAAAERGEGGVFRSSGGSPLERLRVSGADIILKGVDGKDRPVPQVMGRAPEAHRQAHDELECYACHSGWMQNYFRVERTLDLRREGFDPVGGGLTPGVASEKNDLVSVDDYFIGLNVDGKVGTFMAEHATYSVIANCDPRTDTATCTVDLESAQPGKYIVENYIGNSSEGRKGLYFMPAFQHTVQPAGGIQPCLRCHPKTNGSNLDAVRAVYGFGKGEPLFTDAAGRTIDATMMVDDTATSSTALGHLLPRPLPLDRIQKALGVLLP